MSSTPVVAEPPREEKPQTLIDKISTAMPIALTALATVFAGMSTSELQRAMFWRTAAGQDQAQATNKWTHAGLKRSRALVMEGADATLTAQSGGKAANFPPLSGGAPP